MADKNYSAFVETSNVRRFRDGLKQVEDRAAKESAYVVVKGEWGFGKTALGLHHAVQNEIPFVRIKAACTPPWVLNDWLIELGETPRHGTHRKYDQLLEALAKNRRPVIFDEVENALPSPKVLGTIRDVIDLIQVPCVLIGREFISSGLKRDKPLWSRVSRVVELKRLNEDDMRALLKERGPVKVDADLLEELLEKTEGRVRLALGAVQHLRKISARHDGRTLTLKDVSAVDLVDEATRRKEAEKAAASAANVQKAAEAA